jgi:hypothetical protein
MVFVNLTLRLLPRHKPIVWKYLAILNNDSQDLKPTTWRLNNDPVAILDRAILADLCNKQLRTSIRGSQIGSCGDYGWRRTAPTIQGWHRNRNPEHLPK